MKLLYQTSSRALCDGREDDVETQRVVSGRFDRGTTVVFVNVAQVEARLGKKNDPRRRTRVGALLVFRVGALLGELALGAYERRGVARGRAGVGRLGEFSAGPGRRAPSPGF